VSGTDELTDGDLNYDDLQGTPMRVAGYVYASDENTDPVADAKIEIWHTDDNGAYHPQGNGPASRYSDDEISLRGYVTSDEDGYYEFTSIFPGEYEGRSRHIHVRVSGDGISDRISQIITSIEGDRFPPSGDMVARGFSDCNIVDPVELDGTRTVLFNFHIQPA
jgi:protocatechuate 3,4-dioxygenase beta subunit